MKILKKYICLPIFVAALALTFTSCKDKKKEDEVTPENSFDKSGMLANISDNLIIPSYEKLKISIDSMQLLTNQFVANPTAVSLIDLQTKFLQAYTNYQDCSTFEFGPGENEMVRANFNIFPCDTGQINTNISTGVYNLATAENIDAKGLSALDFLLFRFNQNTAQILANYISDVNATNAKSYLASLMNELKSKSDAVNTAWAVNGGNYGSTFKSNTGSDVGGSIGMLVNQLNYDFELLKNAKIGIPLGKKTFGTPIPEKVEAYYSTQSLVLVTEHLKSIENIYLGRNSQNADGLGLDDYLAHAKAQHSLGLLNDVIKDQFTLAKTKLAAIPGALSQAVVSNAAIVDAAYAELQKLVVLLKVDVPSALGILITYQDNDGD
ncbi:MAG: imelysin family protein [Bacteroidota bacterium]